MVKPGGTGMPRVVISARPAPLPPSTSFIAGGAVGAPLAEEVDQRLRVGAAHTGVATSGEACRSCTRIAGVGVGYSPEKQAWQ